MSLKSKLITTISMFVLVLAMTIVGVFAVTSATINMGGNITFVADDINAIVTGKIDGANETHVLDTLTYSATQEPEGDVSTWVGNNLTFKQDTKEPIKITVTVENKSTERWLIVRVEDTILSIDNVNKSITKDRSSYTQNTDVVLEPSTGEGTSEVEFVITLSLADSNKSVASAPYSYIIHLNNSNEEPEQPSEPQELDFTFAGNKVTGYTGNETNITIPSSYSVKPVEATEFIVTLLDFNGETPEGPNKIGILMALSGYTLHLSNGKEIKCNDGFNTIQDNIDEISTNLPMTVDLTGVDLTFTFGENGLTPGQEQALGGFLQGYWYKQATDSDWVDSSVTPLPETLNYPVTIKVNNKINKYFEGNGQIVDTIGAIFSLSQSGTDAVVLTIPSTIKNIDPYAFQYNTVPFTVVFEDRIELPAIGEHAFATDSLKSLILPENLKVIPENAFSDCSGLTELTIPSSLTEIGGAAFYGCSGITELVIPNSVTTIGGGAFDNCTGIKKLTYNSNLAPVDCGDGPGNNTYFATKNFGSPDGLEVIIGPDVKVIYNGIFSQSGYGYYSNTNILKITIQGDVELIENNAFERCNKLVSINFPSSLKTIGVEAFQYCNSLQSVIFEEGSALTTISASAFSGCISITGELIIPARVTTIGNDSFRGCSGLTSLTFADNSQLITIGNSAFYNCSGLIGNLIIPEGVETIGDYAFSGCNKLTGELKIPEGVTTIGEGAFSSCKELTSVTIPEGVTSIENWTFSFCAKLTSVTIPEGVTSIGDYVFNDCSNLTSLTLPRMLTKIGDYAFNDCSKLSSITIPAPVRTIGREAFKGCNALTSLTFNENSQLATIGDYAFYNCSALTGSLVIPAGVTTIGNYAFHGCSGLTGELKIPAGVTTIGGDAFSGCSGLTLLTFNGNSNLTTIGNSAFSACSGLSLSIFIPAGVTTIGRSAFAGCSGLTSINLPNSLAEIGWGVFSSCSNLTEIKGVGNSYYTIDNNRALIVDGGKTIIAYAPKASGTSYTVPAGVTTIENSVFFGCSGLTSITIPEGVTTIGDGAFYGCEGLTSITVNAPTHPSLRSENEIPDNVVAIYVPEDSVRDYKVAYGWKNYADIIKPIPKP